MKKISLLLVSGIMLFSSVSLAQVPVANPVLTADSLASGNYKDVLNSFFQLAVERLTGPNKELKFTATPFGVMAKLDSTLLIDRNYEKHRTLRKFNFSFAGNLDSSYKFNGFTSGVKFAIINQRDETVSRAFVNLVLYNHSVKQILLLNDSISKFITGISGIEKQRKLIQDYTDFRQGKKNLDQLDKAVRDTLLALAKRDTSTKELAKLMEGDPAFNIRKRADDIYADLKANFNKNWLWTIGVSDTTYKDEFAFSNIVFASDVLRGLNKFEKRKNDLELNIHADLQMVDDSLQVKRDLKRMVLNFEPGLNLVLKTKITKKSYLEWKLSGGYSYTFSDLYANEKRNRLTLNSTIRVRILNDIWIPIEIKYDPANGNVFGFLNVHANFKALGDTAKQLF